jgi:hypothetical protein
MVRSLCILILALPAAALADPPLPAAPLDGSVTWADGGPAPLISQWADTHPAMSSLATWTQENPDAARQVFWWNRRHPLRAQSWLRWILDHPDQSIDEFTSAHQGWPATNLVLNPNGEALAGLAAWVRAHPAAVQDLLSEPRGFAWVGFHDLDSLWVQPAADPETPSAR